MAGTEDKNLPSSSHPAGKPDEAPSGKPKFGWRAFFLKGAVGILGMLILLLLAIQIGIRFYSDEIAGSLLKNVVAYKSEGLYKVTYEKISLNFLKQQLEITGLRIKPDSSFYDAETLVWDTGNAVYELFVPQLSIRVSGLREIYQTKDLDIRQIIIERPELSMYHFKADSATSQSDGKKGLKIGSPYFLISDYLNSFKVGEFGVENGRFVMVSYGPAGTFLNSLNSVTVTVNDFLVDSATTFVEGKPFSTSGIRIALKNEVMRLPNLPYRIKVGSFFFDTQQYIAEVRDLSISTMDELAKPEDDIIELSVPRIYLDGIDFRQAYFEKKINVGNILISSPDMAFQKRGAAKNAGADADPTQAIIERLLSFVESVIIYEVKIEEGKVAFSSPKTPNKQASQLSIPNVSVQMRWFLLDSVRKESGKSHFFVDNIDFQLKDFKINLPDSLHYFQVGEFGVSTTDYRIFARQAFILPRKEAGWQRRMINRQKKLHYNFYLPVFEMANVDVWQLIEDRSLEADRILVSLPEFHLHQYDWMDSLMAPRADSLQAAQLDFRNIYPLLKGSLASIDIGQFDLENADVQMKRYLNDTTLVLHLDNLGLQTRGFLLNKESHKDSSRLFFSQSFRLAADQGGLALPDSLHSFHFDDFWFSSADSSLRLSRPSIVPMGKMPGQQDSLTQDGTSNLFIADQLSIRQIHLHALYYDSLLRIGHVDVQNPKIKIEKTGVKQVGGKSKKPFALPYIKNASIDQFDLVNGSLVAQSEQGDRPGDLCLARIDVCGRMLGIDTTFLANDSLVWMAEDLELLGQGLDFFLADSLHHAQIGQLGFSLSGGRTYFHELLVERVEGRPMGPNQSGYDVSLPFLHLENVDWYRLYHEKRLLMDRLALANAHVKLALPAEAGKVPMEGALSIDRLYEVLGAWPKEVLIRDLSLKDNNLWVVGHRAGQSPMYATARKLALEVEDFRLSPERGFSPERLFYSDKVRFEGGPFSYQLPGGQQLALKKIAFDHTGENVLLEGIRFGPQKNFPNSHKLVGLAPGNSQEVELAALSLRKLDLYKALLQKELVIEEVRMANPEIWLVENQVGKANLGPAKEKTRPTAIVPFSQDSLFRAISPIFEKIAIGKLGFDNGKVNLRSYQADTLVDFTAYNLQLRIRNIMVG
jgi:hypothetical protein